LRWASHVHRLDFRSAILGQRSRQVYSDGAEHRFLLHLNWRWTDCAPVKGGVTLDSTGCWIGCARGWVREFVESFGDLNFGIDPFDDDVCVVGMEVQHTG
jgi:hypothetical protein